MNDSEENTMAKSVDNGTMSTAEARRNVESDISMLTSEGVPRAVAAGFMHGVIAAVEVIEADVYGEPIDARSIYHKAATSFLSKWRAKHGDEG